MKLLKTKFILWMTIKRNSWLGRKKNYHLLCQRLTICKKYFSYWYENNVIAIKNWDKNCEINEIRRIIKKFQTKNGTRPLGEENCWFQSGKISRSITEQNNLLEDNVKVVYIRKDENGSQTLFCECTSQFFNKIVAQKIYILVDKDLDIPHVFVIRNRKDIIIKLASSICGNDHEEKESSKRKKFCKSCNHSNEKYKTKYNVDHHANDEKCTTLEYFKKILQNETNNCELTLFLNHLTLLLFNYLYKYLYIK